jgi:hypothetical protein
MATLFVIRTRDWALPECVGSLITKFHFTQTCLRVDRCNLQCVMACTRMQQFLTTNETTKEWTDSMEQSPSSESSSSSAGRQIPAFYRNRMFITVFTRARHLSLPVHSLLSHFLKSIVILSSLLSSGHPSGLFPSDFPTKRLHVFFFSPHTCHMFRPSHDPCTNNEAIYC